MASNIQPVDLAIPFQITNTQTPRFSEGLETLGASIYAILSTTPGERPYRPFFGSWLRRYVFMNLDTANSLRARSEIRRAVRQWEPRVEVLNVSFAIQESSLALTVRWRPNGADQDSTTLIAFDQ